QRYGHVIPSAAAMLRRLATQDAASAGVVISSVNASLVKSLISHSCNVSTANVPPNVANVPTRRTPPPTVITQLSTLNAADHVTTPASPPSHGHATPVSGVAGLQSSSMPFPEPSTAPGLTAGSLSLQSPALIASPAVGAHAMTAVVPYPSPS